MEFNSKYMFLNTAHYSSSLLTYEPLTLDQLLVIILLRVNVYSRSLQGQTEVLHACLVPLHHLPLAKHVVDLVPQVMVVRLNAPYIGLRETQLTCKALPSQAEKARDPRNFCKRVRTRTSYMHTRVLYKHT